MTTTVDVEAARRRATSGFCLYDVANSAFVTTVVTAVGGPFIVAVAKHGSQHGRAELLGLHLRPGAIFAYATSLSVLLQVLALPLLGAVADRTSAKRALLVRGTAVGVVATLALAVVPLGSPLLAVLAFVVANVAFGVGVLAYNAFLHDVARPEETDRVSARAYAQGYAGGGFVLAIDLVVVQAHGALGLSKGDAARVAIASAGLWWGAVGAIAARRLQAVELLPTPPPGPVTPGGAVRQLRSSLAALRALPHTARYLLAFLLFNDAIQAVVSLSAVVLTQELYVAKGLQESDATAFLLTLVLLIQVVAVPGAWLSARFAEQVGTKTVLLAELAVWAAIVLYAVVGLNSTTAAYGLGVFIALVLGGTQALARSLFSRMVPEGRQASFFGFYELAERGTAWIGSLVFGIVLEVTGSYRGAFFSLLALFAAGGLLLASTDTDAAIEDAAR